MSRVALPALRASAGVVPMSNQSRVENLLRAAERAEREGNRTLAAVLKKMAEELVPPDLTDLPLQASTE